MSDDIVARMDRESERRARSIRLIENLLRKQWREAIPLTGLVAAISERASESIQPGEEAMIARELRQQAVNVTVGFRIFLEVAATQDFLVNQGLIVGLEQRKRHWRPVIALPYHLKAEGVDCIVSPFPVRVLMPTIRRTAHEFGLAKGDALTDDKILIRLVCEAIWQSQAETWLRTRPEITRGMQ